MDCIWYCKSDPFKLKGYSNQKPLLPICWTDWLIRGLYSPFRRLVGGPVVRSSSIYQLSSGSVMNAFWLENPFNLALASTEIYWKMLYLILYSCVCNSVCARCRLRIMWWRVIAEQTAASAQPVEAAPSPLLRIVRGQLKRCCETTVRMDCMNPQ